MAAERLDVIIFGATGFTGKCTVAEAAKLSKEKPFTWGVAGRRKEALETVLKEFAPEKENVPIVIADINDDESLKKMAERAKVIVNCCGPYRLYGEAVVKACIQAGTHQVDVNGEPQYMERMELEYGKQAKEAGVYIISACGFDSIPCDLGVIFAQDKFNGDVNSVESYLNSWKTTNLRGPVIHSGTWESIIYGLTHASELGPLRRQLYPEKLPELKPRLKTKSLVHKSSVSEGWSTIFPGSDRSVVYRSQRFLYETYKQRPAQIQTYVTFTSFCALILAAIIGLVLTVLTKFECGRNLLRKHPKLFSAGIVTHEDLNAELIKNIHFSVTLKAEGWSEKLAEPTDAHTDPPNKEMIVKVTGVNPGYGATCTCLVFSALTILRDSDKMPNGGGVLTPGAAFGKTSIIEELNKHDLTFEVISSIEK